MKLTLLALALASFSASSNYQPYENWYKCTVKASSHTGRYTFRINTRNCSVYWKEIDTQLEVTQCRLPIIQALKPSAISELDIVSFNMKTGQFYDYLSGVHDRGTCIKTDKP